MKPKSEAASSPTRAAPPETLADLGVTTHENVYRELKERILFGGFKPGSAITLRGLAEALGVSPMPIREAVRRLIAERALEMQGNRRVLVPPMTPPKFEQIIFARQALEPELAARALGNLTKQTIARLAEIDDKVDQAMQTGDVEGYMRANFNFHFAIYREARADMLLSLTESIWLQFGPFMRTAYGRLGTSTLDDHHQAALAAMRKRDLRALRTAISADIGQGMSFIGTTALKPPAAMPPGLA